MDLLKLQNGSDIRGVASEGVEGEKVNLREEEAWKIGYAFAGILSKKEGRKIKISLGRDSRITGSNLLKSAAEGIVASGNDVIDFGIASTPSMFMSVMDNEMALDGAIMITASHLPFNRNGMKFFTKEGGANKAFIKEILEEAEKVSYKAMEEINLEIECYNYILKYAKELRNKIIEDTGTEKPLSGSRIIVDAGNGSGGFFVNNFLEPLGADTEGSLFIEPDGMFPNHVPNPEDKTAIEFIQKQVLSTKADLGIIFDTDVDRAALIDSKGNAINRNRLIALIGAVVLKEHPGSYIVTDSVTSKGLKKFVEENKGIHHRYKRGYKNVIDEAIRLNNEGKESWLAIETSGHGALKENYFLDDGAYLMVKLLIEFANLRNEGKNLFDLIENLEEPFEEKEIRINIGDENFKAYGEKIMEELKAYAVKREGWTVESPNFEGIRVNCDKNNGDGWFLLRLSLHDPVLPLNIESDVSGGCEIIGKELMAFLSKFSLLFV